MMGKKHADGRINETWVFSEMSFPRLDRLAHSDGGFIHVTTTNKCRLRGPLFSWRYMRLNCLRKVKKRKESGRPEKSSSE